MNFTKLCYVIVTFFLVSSCTQDTVFPEGGTLTIEFDNHISTIDDLELNTSVLNTLSGEHVSISELKYIISDVVLYDAQGNVYVYPRNESYFVINESIEASKKIVFENLPKVRIQKIGFKIGFVDKNQLENEGLVTVAEKEGLVSRKDQVFKGFSIKGDYLFEGDNKQYNLYTNGNNNSSEDEVKEIVVNFPTPLMIKDTDSNHIRVLAKVNKVFDSANAINLKDFVDKSESEKNILLLENICNMFSVLN